MKPMLRSSYPGFVSCTSKTSRKASVDKPLALTPTLSQREREFSPFSPGRRGGDEGGGLAVQLATAEFRFSDANRSQ